MHVCGGDSKILLDYIFAVRNPMVASRFQRHKVARDRRTTVPRDCGGDSKILLDYIFVKYC